MRGGKGKGAKTTVTECDEIGLRCNEMEMGIEVKMEKKEDAPRCAETSATVNNKETRQCIKQTMQDDE